MDVCPPLIADLQPPETVQPSQRALDHPAIATQTVAGLDALAGDTRRDASAAARPPIRGVIVPLVGVQFLRPFARPSASAPNGRDGIQGGFEHLAVIHVGCRDEDGQREAVPLDHQMALRARFAPICRVGAARFAPPGAGTLAESSEARDQSSRPASLKRWSKVWCTCSHTPACCQSRSRRQQVIPLPQPSSWGSISHGMPLLRTKTMPVRAARLHRRGRPPLGLGGSGGRSGSTMAHSSSGINGLLIPPVSRMRSKVLLGVLSPTDRSIQRAKVPEGRKANKIQARHATLKPGA